MIRIAIVTMLAFVFISPRSGLAVQSTGHGSGVIILPGLYGTGGGHGASTIIVPGAFVERRRM
ncbi:MAG: hypothetical protein ACKVS6_16840 [Planctomycetota bacterium]